MAAFAVVELLKAGNYQDEARKVGAVLRVPSDVAARWVKTETATPYTGQKKPENLKKSEVLESMVSETITPAQLQESEDVE